MLLEELAIHVLGGEVALVLCWKRSSTLRRGAVTLRPVLLSSRGSLMASAALMVGKSYSGSL
jgi:hypothetical protein